MTTPLHELLDHGQSVWMDNLSRSILVSGELAGWIESWGLRGITSNPAIFQKSIEGNADYDAAIAQAIREGLSVNEIYESLVFEDITQATEIFAPVYSSSDGVDGYISIEVSPKLANDTLSTIAEGKRFFAILNRPNVMIKVPGTAEGLPAVTALITEGINVNVTLLFSVENYIQTAEAYIEGLERLASRGGDLGKVASVASFFLSRIDSNVDSKLAALAQANPDQAEALQALMGKVAIANAKIAYQEYKRLFSGERWQALATQGARPQRLLWASTSTKNPAYPDTLYVRELIGPDTVNTMPPETIAAFLDHGEVVDSLDADLDEAKAVLAAVTAAGIDLDVVMVELQTEGVTKFVQPFEHLFAALQSKVDQLAAV